ncbi:predicted protein [Histoplasma capsulatum var. duboisii H88]|uniref:Predicted protein n=2 Tax=Ajellomyces capsulatus TaxID=5037 RepID=F0UDN3_AJEC8|nr:predicted protein [Histoplasma capsulatum H143]EGC43564.1 predicted protein [Histoplasma capsulatum var. duboisii H88]
MSLLWLLLDDLSPEFVVLALSNLYHSSFQIFFSRTDFICACLSPPPPPPPPSPPLPPLYKFWAIYSTSQEDEGTTALYLYQAMRADLTEHVALCAGNYNYSCWQTRAFHYLAICATNPWKLRLKGVGR